MVVTQVLGMENHRVLLANNADEGWRQWRQNSSSIKLVITDINMPGGANGIALGQAIQEEDRTVPVIYTSGYRATHQFEELMVGNNYLPKPFGMSDLLKVVNRNLVGQEKNWAAMRAVPA
jgi:DNA-binding NtrC family response regulator